MGDFDAKLGLVEVDIQLLKGADYNPRREMSDSERASLNGSIEKFGLVQNIVVNMHPGREYTIVSGHQRVKSLKMLGAKKAMVKMVDLDMLQEKKLNISMNAINAGWDNVKLQEMADGMTSETLESVGFTNTEANAIVAKLFEYPMEAGAKKEQQQREDDVKEEITAYTCPVCGYQGDMDEFLRKDSIFADKEGEDEDIS